MVKRIKTPVKKKSEKIKTSPRLNPSRDDLNLVLIKTPPSKFIIDDKIQEIRSALFQLDNLVLPFISSNQHEGQMYLNLLQAKSNIQVPVTNPLRTYTETERINQQQFETELIQNIPARQNSAIQTFLGTGVNIFGHIVVNRQRDYEKFITTMDKKINRLIYNLLSTDYSVKPNEIEALALFEGIIIDYRAHFNQIGESLITSIQEPFQRAISNSIPGQTIGLAIPSPYFNLITSQPFLTGFKQTSTIESTLNDSQLSSFNYLAYTNLAYTDEHLKIGLIEQIISVYFNFTYEDQKKISSLLTSVNFDQFIQNIQISYLLSKENCEMNLPVLYKLNFYNCLDLFLQGNSSADTSTSSRNIFNDYESIITSLKNICNIFNSNFEYHFEEVFELISEIESLNLDEVKPRIQELLTEELDLESQLEYGKINEEKYNKIKSELKSLTSLRDKKIFVRNLINILSNNLSEEIYEEICNIYYKNSGLINLNEFFNNNRSLGDRACSELLAPSSPEQYPPILHTTNLHANLKKHGRMDASIRNCFLLEAHQISKKPKDQITKTETHEDDLLCRFTIAEYLHRLKHKITNNAFAQINYEENIIKIVNLIDQTTFHNFIHNFVVNKINGQTFNQTIKKDLIRLINRNSDFSEEVKLELISFLEALF